MEAAVPTFTRNVSHGVLIGSSDSGEWQSGTFYGRGGEVERMEGGGWTV